MGIDRSEMKRGYNPLEKQEECYSRMHLREIEQAGVVMVVVLGQVAMEGRTGRRKRNIMLHHTIMH